MPRTTLTCEGLPEGDEPNVVTVRYTKPVTDSAAWLTDTFTAIDEYVDAGTAEIVSTGLDLPGVYRKEEASNKAIIKLRRANNRQRISFIAVDEGIMFQPGDVLEINDSNRGITGLQVFVESAVMIDYGRWRISGIRYRDTDYSDECYVDDDDYGKWVDVLGPPVVYIDCEEYACDAFSTGLIAAGATGYWKLDEDNDTDNAIDYSGNGNNLTRSGSPNAQQAIAHLDACETEVGRQILASEGFRDLTAGSFVTSLSGAVGLIFDQVDNQDFRIFQINFRGTGGVTLAFGVGSSGEAFCIPGASSGWSIPSTASLRFSNAFSGASSYFILFAWTLDATTGALSIDLYVDGDFVATKTGSFTKSPMETITIGGSPYFFLGSTGGNGIVIAKDAFYFSGPISAATVASITNSYDRNFTAYVDPNCA